MPVDQILRRREDLYVFLRRFAVNGPYAGTEIVHIPHLPNLKILKITNSVRSILRKLSVYGVGSLRGVGCRYFLCLRAYNAKQYKKQDEEEKRKRKLKKKEKDGREGNEKR